ncbi:hypothetical protein PVAG01_00012 [Phlyctema vagabunda]|uniref:Uncharacterized protein n=1 Tax=Phlyctema vagabunda TaxID=108571 RepID=A0ABR4PTI6_9HELO
MIKIFEKEDAFATFGGERDRSLSSNCHVLLALLEWNDEHKYASQILKTATFVCQFWWNHDGIFKDKWHLSHLYPTMLMVEAFIALLRYHESKPDLKLLSEELTLKVSIALFQACTRTLLEQRDDGSWGGSPEQTAYAVLTLAEACSLCFFEDFQPHLKRSIESGATFLKGYATRGTQTLERYWTSKTSYSVKFVFEAYILAALKVSTELDQRQKIGRTLGLSHRISQMSRYIPLLRGTKLFSAMPEWQIWASLVESTLFIPLLEARRLEIFPRDTFNKTKDSYLDIIPFTWIGCNNRSKTFAPTVLMFDLMVISLMTYQIDEFMESVAAPAFSHDPNGLHSLIDAVTNETVQKSGSLANDAETTIAWPPNVYKPLALLANHVLGHEHIRAASIEDRKWAAQEFKNLLHAHATQGEDVALYSQQLRDGKGAVYDTTRPYFKWVRTTGADHVAVSLPLAWTSCWMSANLGDGVDVFERPTEKYFLTAAERHLSSSCRMCNDFSSVTRDTAESNVNSIFYPEFDKISSEGLPTQKLALAKLADYEQSCLEHALDSLEEAVSDTTSGKPNVSFCQRKVHIVRYYFEVGQLYNQLYMLRDLSASNARPS